MERWRVRAEVKERIDYEGLKAANPDEDLDAYVDLITDALTETSEVIRVGARQMPAETVRERFSALTRDHIEYVILCLRRNAQPVKNVYAYLFTVLFNAPTTMEAYYNSMMRAGG